MSEEERMRNMEIQDFVSSGTAMDNKSHHWLQLKARKRKEQGSRNFSLRGFLMRKNMQMIVTSAYKLNSNPRAPYL